MPRASSRNRRNVVERLQIETLQGQYFFQDLYNREVYFDDFDDKSGDYFRLDYDPSFNLHAGKNLIAIRGNSDTMQVGTELLIEAVDAAGDLVKTQIYDLNNDAHERVISLDITPQTPAGDMILTIIGTARVAPDGTRIPNDWRNRSNMKWTRVFTAKPHQPNKSQIIYNDSNRPQISIEEVSHPFYNLGFNQELSSSIGWTGNETSSYVLSSSVNTNTKMSYRKSGDKFFVTAHDGNSGNILDFGGFTPDMQGGILMIKYPENPRPSSINGYSANPVFAETEQGDGLFDEEANDGSGSFIPGGFMTSILEIMSPFEARTSSPHTTWQGLTTAQYQEFEHFEFDASNYELMFAEMPLTYTSAPTGSQGEDLRTSYAKVRFDNLEPLTGDVTRIKCYMKNHQAPFDWVMASDNALEAQELLYRRDHQKHRMPIGDFSTWGVGTDISTLEKYWETEGVGTQAPSMSIYTQGGAGENPPVNDNLMIGDNNQALDLDGTAFWWLKAKESASFYQDQWYELSLKAVSVKTLVPTWTQLTQDPIVEPSMKLYITGSAFTDGTDDYGKYIGKIEDVSVRKKHVEFDLHDDFKEVGYKFIFKADGTETGMPRFKIDSGIWHVWDISIKPWDRKGYTPGTFDVIFPTVKCNVGVYDSLDFKFEFYNDYGEISNYTAVVEKVPWQNEFTQVFTHIHTNLLQVTQTASFTGTVELNGTVALFTASDGPASVGSSGSIFANDRIIFTGSGGVSTSYAEHPSDSTIKIITISASDGGGGTGNMTSFTVQDTTGTQSFDVVNNDHITFSYAEILASATAQTVVVNPGTQTIQTRLYNKEAIQDIVGEMVTGNTETNIVVTYQDGDGTLDFAAAAGDPADPSSGCTTVWNHDPSHEYGGSGEGTSTAVAIPGYEFCNALWNPTYDIVNAGLNMNCPTTIGNGPRNYFYPSYSAEYYHQYAEKTWLQVNNWAHIYNAESADVKYAAIFNTTANPIPANQGDVPCYDLGDQAGHGVKIMTSTVPIGVMVPTKGKFKTALTSTCAAGMSVLPGPMVGSSYMDPKTATFYSKTVGKSGLANAYYLTFYHWEQSDNYPSGRQNFSGGIRKHCNSYQNTVVFEYSSDARLKTNIKDTKWGISDLMKIKVRDFNYKNAQIIDEGIQETGFIAQELQEVYPEAAFGNEYGNVDEDPMTVAPDKLIPMMIKSIQDQQEVIKQLSERIKKLENNNVES